MQKPQLSIATFELFNFIIIIEKLGTSVFFMLQTSLP